MKLKVLVSTHSTDTASTFIVPMRSVLLVTARPLVGEGLMSRATAMPRRGSHLNVSVEASAVPAGVRGVLAKDVNGAACRPKRQKHQPQEGRLPGAGWAGQKLKALRSDGE